MLEAFLKQNSGLSPDSLEMRHVDHFIERRGELQLEANDIMKKLVALHDQIKSLKEKEDTARKKSNGNLISIQQMRNGKENEALELARELIKTTKKQDLLMDTLPPIDPSKN